VRKDILSNLALAAKGRKEGLDSCIISDPGTRDITDRMIADAMEAVMGAVYLDGGEGALESVMRHLGLDQHKHLPVILGAHSKCPAIVERVLRSWCGV
jgi:ribonuclease-3